MYRNIMVPLDGSHMAEGALETGVEIARRSGGVLHLTRVVSWLAELTDMSTARSPRRYLNRIAEHLTASGVRVETHLLSDAINGVAYGRPPRRAIAEVLDEFRPQANIDLTVMTSHGRSGFKRAWLGSVADSMLRYSNGNVLLLRSGTPARRKAPLIAKRILVPVDVTEDCDELIARAIELGFLYDAEYTLLHVEAPLVSLVPAMTEVVAETTTVEPGMPQEVLTRISDRMAKAGFTARTDVVVMPFVSAEIIAYAQDHDFDVIVVSTRGPNSVTRALLGSVADKVIRGAKVPVLACNIVQ